MRVLHFVETLAGGPATHINELLTYQTQSYDHVAVLCPSEQSHMLAVEGAVVFPFPAAARTLRGLIDLYKHFDAHVRTNSYDVIHLHSSFAGTIGRLRVPRPAGATVYCAHGWAFAMDISVAKKAVYRLIERVLAYRTDATVNVSRSEDALAGRIGIPRNKRVLVHNGLRDADWLPLPAGRRAARLLFVGRFDRQKGLDILVDAMTVLSLRGFALEVIGGPVIGHPTVADLPASMINRGWRSPSEVDAAMSAADIVVMPSRWEGLPFVAAEAMRAGRPVVAAAVGGVPEMVVDGETGVLCVPDSPQALAEAVMRLSEMDIRKIGENGRKRYEELFTAEMMFQRIDAVYRETCADRAARPGRSSPGREQTA